MQSTLEELLNKPDVSSKQKIVVCRCLCRLKLDALNRCTESKSNRDEIKNFMSCLEKGYQLLKNLDMSSDGDGKLIVTEATWFNKIAWNEALQQEKKPKLMYEFFKLCSEFAEFGTEDVPNLVKKKTCMLMTIAAGLERVRQMTSNDPQKYCCLMQVLSYIQNCKDIDLKIFQLKKSKKSVVDSVAAVLLLYEYEAKSRMGQNDSLCYLVDLVKNIPPVEAKTYLIMAGLSMEGIPVCTDACIHALNLAIEKLISDKDYSALSKAYHSLIELHLQNNNAEDKNKEAWTVATQLANLLEDLDEAQYPEMEIIWLMTKVWNVGIHYLSSGQSKSAISWCTLAMRILQQLKSLKANYENQMNTIFTEILCKAKSQ